MDRSNSISLKTRYLIAYNFLSACLWLGVLGQTVILLPLVGHTNLYLAVGEYTKWTQTLAILEAVHVLTGLTRSSLPTTLLQIASRILTVWGVCDRFEASKTTPAYATMLIAWGVTEVCRYAYYVVNLSRATSGFLTWLRYNTFFVLYPLGAGSETWCMYAALPEAWDTSRLYYWFLVITITTYVPGLYKQYTHMIGQRRKNIRGKKRAPA